MFFEKSIQGYILRVRLSPNSSSCRTNGIIQDAKGDSFLKINVVSIPEKGKANKELTEFLASRLKITKSSIRIISGESGQWKKIVIASERPLEEKLFSLAKETL